VGTVVPVRFKKRDLRKIDMLIERGLFKSRSEAIRRLSLEAAEKRLVNFTTSNLSEAVKAILKALEKNRSSLSITLEEKIADFITEGRDRL